MDELEAIKVTFFQEREELLADLEGDLGHAGRATTMATPSTPCRAVHSIKGGAGPSAWNRWCASPTCSRPARRAALERIPGTPDLTALLLRASDVLADHVSAARGLGVVDMDASAAMAAELKIATDPNAAPAAAPVEEAARPRPMWTPPRSSSARETAWTTTTWASTSSP